MSDFHSVALSQKAAEQAAAPIMSPVQADPNADHMVIVALAIIACLANASWTVTGFGAGIVFQIGWQIAYIVGIGSGEVKMGVLCSAAMQIFMASIQAWHLRKSANVRLVAYLAIPSCIFVIIGLEALFAIKGNLIKQLLGLLFMLLAGQRAFQLCRKRISGGKDDDICVIDENTPACTKVTAVSAGSASGLMAGMFGLPGPALMVFVSFNNIEYNVWRASNARVRGALIVTLISYAAARGELKGGDWQLYVTVIIAGLFGVVLGNQLAKCISQSIFPWLILMTLFYGALLMLTSGSSHEVQEIAALFVVGSVLLAIVIGLTLKLVRYCSRRRIQGGATELDEIAKSPAPTSAADDDGPTISMKLGSAGKNSPTGVAEDVVGEGEHEGHNTISHIDAGVVCTAV
jgi:uncharacterized membrane protein YfcA